MARTIGKIIEIKRFDTGYAFKDADLYTALDATDGLELNVSIANDSKITYYAWNNTDAEAQLTIKGGNHGTQTGRDLVLTVPATSKIAFALNTADFKNVFGADSGKILFTGANTLFVGATRLP